MSWAFIFRLMSRAIFSTVILCGSNWPLHKAEIRKLQAQVMRDGYTLIPLSVDFSKNRAKLEVGVCKGKKLYDKRAAAKAKDDAREMERAFRERQK